MLGCTRKLRRSNFFYLGVFADGRPFDSQAKYQGREFGEIEFPLQYKYYPESFAKGSDVNVSIGRDGLGKPVLRFNTLQGEIVLKPKTVIALLKKIPLMYPRSEAFRILRESFMKEAVRHLDQIRPAIRKELMGRQLLLFKLMNYPAKKPAKLAVFDKQKRTWVLNKRK